MARLSPFRGRPFALLALLAPLAGGCAAEKGSPRSPRAPGAPVVLVSIDTLRADHLPVYGYGAVSTPHIDELRKDSILFANAYSHCPLTLPSHVSLLTGLLPPEHGVRNNIGYRLEGKAHPTLASLLKAQGYATGAAVSAYVLRRTTGIDSGFDFYGEVVTATGAKAAAEVQRPGTDTVRVALDWLRGVHDPRVLLFVHLYEPHTPYDPPEPFRARYGATYDGEIAAADAAVGDLVAGLRALGLYDKALVVLLSDHGEGLGDHGEAEHGVLLYREALHVPLLLKLPRSERQGATEDAPAGLRDVLPTVAAVLGLEKPAGIGGRNLLRHEGVEAAAIYSETYYPRIHLGWSELRSLVDARYHFIDGPRPELYDVVRDPAERNDQIGERAALAQSMREALRNRSGVFTAPAAATNEEMEKLRSLGYLTAGAAPLAPGASLPNPNEQIGSFTRMRAAFALATQGKDEEALRMLEEILAANPGLVDAQAERAATLGRLGRYREADKAYRKAIGMAPTLAPSLSLTLGRVHLEMGNLKDAAEAARRALESEPGPAHELLASVALAGEDLDEAERQARLVVSDAGAQARADVVLAEVLARRGQHAQALDYLAEAGRRHAALGLGPVPYFEFVRGDVLARLGRHAEAETALRAEIGAFPNHARAYASLAIVTALLGRPLEESRRILEEMHRAQPRPQTALLAAKALDFIGDASGAAAWRRRAAQPVAESRRPS
jgi:arylsulfatase A-like enzyme/Tfp pilus assembly protein PilF